MSILSGLSPMPGTSRGGAKPACSTSAKWFAGLRSSTIRPTVIGGESACGHTLVRSNGLKRYSAASSKGMICISSRPSGAVLAARAEALCGTPGRPLRRRARGDGVPQVTPEEVGVVGHHRVGLRQREVLDALDRLEVVLHPEPLALRVHPGVRVAAVAVHVPVRARGAAVREEDRDLMRGLG